MSRKIIAPSAKSRVPCPGEYHVVIDAQGGIQVSQLTNTASGSPIPSFDLWLALNKKYGHKSYIYIARHLEDRSLYKVGMSKDPEKRVSKIPSFTLAHTIECKPENVFQLEQKLHRLFNGCHQSSLIYPNELFRLDNHIEFDFIRMLYLIKTEDDLEDWIKRIWEYRVDIQRGWQMAER